MEGTLNRKKRMHAIYEILSQGADKKLRGILEAELVILEREFYPGEPDLVTKN